RGRRAARRSGDGRGGRLADEQPCPGDLARDRLAVADGEEPVAAAVDDERGDLDLGQALAPAGFAVEPGKHHAHLVGHLDRGCGAGRAVPDARSDCARGDGVVAEDLRVGGGELRQPPRGRSNRASDARNSRLIGAWSWSGRSSSGGPGAPARVPTGVSAADAPGWSSTAAWATTLPTPIPARCAGPPPSASARAAASAARPRRV